MSHVRTLDFGSAPFQIIDGDRGKNYPKQDEFSDDGFCVFLSASNVTKNGLDFSQCQFITEQKDSVLRKGKLWREDVVLTTRGTIGNSAFYSESVPFEHLRINSGMVVLRCDKKEILPAYLYHFLRSPQFHGQVNSLRSGVAQPQLPIRDMRSIKLPLPSLTIQRSIVSILSTYDDLIENNRRRIHLLEQSARLLYKEWFVHLRFPGHEHIKIKDSVPVGWEKKILGEVASTNVESYQARELPDDINYVDISSVTQGSITTKNLVSSTEAPGRARRKAKIGDVIWSNVRPNLRAYALVLNPEENDVYSTGFTVLSPVAVPFSYLYLLVTTDEFVSYLVNNATGVGYPAVRPDDFERAVVLVPSKQLLEIFHEMIEPSYVLISLLEKEVKLLAKARDLLLPRLMSGEAVA